MDTPGQRAMSARDGPHSSMARMVDECAPANSTCGASSPHPACSQGTSCGGGGGAIEPPSRPRLGPTDPAPPGSRCSRAGQPAHRTLRRRQHTLWSECERQRCLFRRAGSS
eukprot:scaffold549_cov385-Prasinococcus_capsulatus_cf.AAC.37